MPDFIAAIKTAYLDTQSTLCAELAALDGKATFGKEEWQRAEGGGGITRALSDGAVFEKGGVNFSHVMGERLPPSATQNRPDLAGSSFEALGVSLVMHPLNPYAPTSHMNIRYFQVNPKKGAPVGWFGGGYDLTPYYGFEEDCIEWHQGAKDTCDRFNSGYYPRFKRWCDEYFYLKHRNEPRGIGGIFFDDLIEADRDAAFDFTLAVAKSYLSSYLSIVQRRCNTPYGERERAFQKYRRGRYVEFNLVYDRGTLFGLQSGGRTESILMSLPPEVSWAYAWQPESDTPEAELTSEYLTDKDWVSFNSG